MKTYILISILISFSFLFSFNIFKSKPVANNENYLTSEIESIMNQYGVPDTCITKESLNDTSSVNLIKTEGCDSVFLKQLFIEMQNSHSKTKVFNKSVKRYGVFKNGSCGYYPVLDIYLDCEDDNTNSNPSLTKKDGWTGDSYVTTDKNVHLFFCVVDGEIFNKTFVDYAVLMLNYEFDANVTCIERLLSNEEHNNANSTTVSSSIDYGFNVFTNKNSQFYGDNDSGHDNLIGLKNITILYFNYYEKLSTGFNNFPVLNEGVTYGVLGRFGKNQGYINTDDEDKNNKNYNYLNQWTWDGSVDNDPVKVINFGSVPNILDASHNTRFYISYVNTDPLMKKCTTP